MKIQKNKFNPNYGIQCKLIKQLIFYLTIVLEP